MMDAANLPRSKVDIKVGPNKNSVRKRLTRWIKYELTTVCGC